MSPADIIILIGVGIERVRQLKKIAIDNLRELIYLN